MLENLTQQEIAILLATQYSECVQTAEELAQDCETNTENAQKTIDALVKRNILEPSEQWNGSIGYSFADNEYAQSVYDEIYGPLALQEFISRTMEKE